MFSKNLFWVWLAAVAVSAQAVIDDSNINWYDLEGAQKTGQWYSIIPDSNEAPYTGAFKNGKIVCNATLWGIGGYAPDGSDARTLHIGAGATNVLNALWSGSGRTSVEICIHDGGCFELAGDKSYIGTAGHLQIKVHSGGTLIYGSSRTPNLDEVQCEGNWFDIYGRAEFPYGIKMGNKVGKNHVLYQRAGSYVSFGGDVNRNGEENNLFSYVIEGGTLQITAQCAFDIPAGKGEIAKDAVATIDVPDGVFFDFSPFTSWGEGALLTKTGGGLLGIGGGYAPSIFFKEGSLVLCAADGVYDFSKITFGENPELVIGAKNCRIDSIGEAVLSDLQVSIDLEKFNPGDYVLLSEDDALIDAFKEKIDANLDQNYKVEKEEGALVLQSNSVFNGSNGATSWNDNSGWLGGTVPNGVDVYIQGDGVVCEISGEINAKSITVSDGATLKVSAALTLPPLKVFDNSRILFAEGSDAVLGEFSISGGKATLPVFEVAKGGKVSVPGGTVFHDSKVYLYGTISTYGDGDLVIGGTSAASVGNAWYDFASIGAVINVQNGAFRLSWRSNSKWVEPIKVSDRKLDIKDTTFILANGHEMSFGSKGGTWNPNYGETFDNTVIASDRPVYFGLSNPDNKNNSHSFVNGAGVGIAKGVPSSASVMTIGYGKQSVILEGPDSFINVDSLVYDVSTDPYNWGDIYKRITLRNSSRIRVRTVTGAAKGKFVFGDGIYEVGAFKEGESAPFALCNDVKIEKNGICRIRAIDDTGTPADRAVTLAAAPMSGEGSLSIENNMGGEFSFSATLTSGGNTATGTASADKASRLLFADGANWAGTVVSKGNVAFAGEGAAAVSMGGLQVEEGTLPVRVFVSQDGISCDCVDVGDGGLSFVDGAGISLEIPGGISSLPLGTRLVVAKAPLGTEAPKLRINGFGRLKVESMAGDESRVEIVAVREQTGLLMIFR